MTGEAKKAVYVGKGFKCSGVLISIFLLSSVILDRTKYSNILRVYSWHSQYGGTDQQMVFDLVISSTETPKSSNQTNSNRQIKEPELNVTDRMAHRKAVSQLACNNRKTIDRLMSSGTFEELLQYHKDLYALRVNDTIIEHTSIKPSRYVKVMSHNREPKVQKDFAICLPPKTGSSNWETALIKHFYAKNYTIINDDNIKYFPDEMYEILPRLETMHDLEGVIRILNARNPIGRMVSAWNDKMKTTRVTHYENYWRSIVNEMSQMAPDQPPSGYKVSLKTFVHYILEKSDGELEPHFRPQPSLCQLCAIDYDLITHQEDSSDEWPWILSQINLTGIGINSRYRRHSGNIEKYAHIIHEHGVTPDILKLLYRRFYRDHVYLGYSPQDFTKILSFVMLLP